MIIATIGHNSYKVDTLEQAEALLSLFSKLISLENVKGKDGHWHTAETPAPHDFELKLIADNVLTAEQAAELSSETDSPLKAVN